LYSARHYTYKFDNGDESKCYLQDIFASKDLQNILPKSGHYFVGHLYTQTHMFMY